tara:strand:- start:125 stop:373 length:249 start_codon:yes stop_codon:yes gene_type:complete
MLSIPTKPKSNNFIGDAYWQNVTQEWRFIEAIAKGGLDFKIDEYEHVQQLLKYEKPSYQQRTKYAPPTITTINVPTTIMTSI